MTISTRQASTTAGFGPMLREWRKARGASQLELALNCGLSQRHLSFLESGRSRPSRGMVLHLASALDVPLGQQNAMLLCAGFAPVYKERGLDAADMKPVDLALDHALRQQEPYPALVVDHAHYTLRANRACGCAGRIPEGRDQSARIPGTDERHRNTFESGRLPALHRKLGRSRALVDPASACGSHARGRGDAGCGPAEENAAAPRRSGNRRRPQMPTPICRRPSSCDFARAIHGSRSSR